MNPALPIYADAASPLAVWAGSIVAETLAAVGVAPPPVRVVLRGDWLVWPSRWVGLWRKEIDGSTWLALNGQALGLNPDAVPIGAAAEYARRTLTHESAHFIQARPSRAHGDAFRTACLRLQRALNLTTACELTHDERCRRWPHDDRTPSPTRWDHRPKAAAKVKKPKPAAPPPLVPVRTARLLRLLPLLTGLTLAAFYGIFRPARLAVLREIRRLARVARISDPSPFFQYHQPTRAAEAMLAAI